LIDPKEQKSLKLPTNLSNAVKNDLIQQIKRLYATAIKELKGNSDLGFTDRFYL
jgi:hypothetical protein